MCTVMWVYHPLSIVMVVSGLVIVNLILGHRHSLW